MENGIDTLKLHHDPLLKTLKNTATSCYWKDEINNPVF